MITVVPNVHSCFIPQAKLDRKAGKFVLGNNVPSYLTITWCKFEQGYCKLIISFYFVLPSLLQSISIHYHLDNAMA